MTPSIGASSNTPISTVQQQHEHISLTLTMINSIQPRDAHTDHGPRSSHDMVEFLNSEPPFTDNDTETGTRQGQEHRPFDGKTERRSGGCVQKWKSLWGPSRPDPWLPRKFAVGYVLPARIEQELMSQDHHCSDDMVFLCGRRSSLCSCDPGEI